MRSCQGRVRSMSSSIRRGSGCRSHFRGKRMEPIRRNSARVLAIAGLGLFATLLTSSFRNVAAAPVVTRYEEVKDWPSLPPNVKLGEVAGVSVDANGHVLIFHRPGRGFEIAATAKLT